MNKETFFHYPSGGRKRLLFCVPLLAFFILTSGLFSLAHADEETKSFVQAYVVGKKVLALDASSGEGVDFTVRFVSNSSIRREVRINTTDYDHEKWWVTFEPHSFEVELGKPVDVNVNIKTNYSATDYYEEIVLTIFGDEYNDGNDTGYDTNEVTIKTFVADKWDPVLSFPSSESNKTVTHKKETAFYFTLTNKGYREGVPDVMATVLDTTQGWKVKVVPGPNLGVTTLKSLESVSFSVNVTAPSNIKTGDYQLVVQASVGGSGYTEVSVIAHIQKPDLSVYRVDSDHMIAFVNKEVKLRATIQNDGGKAENVEVGFYLKDMEGNIIPVGSTTIPEMSNFNRTTVSVSWTTIKIDKEMPVENFTIVVEVDEAGKIWERNEANNRGEGIVEVRREISERDSFSSPISFTILSAVVVAVLSAFIYKRRKGEKKGPQQ